MGISLFITILTLILSVILLIFNWRTNKNVLFLAFFFFIFSTYGLSHYAIVYSGSPFWIAIFYAHFSPLWLLLGPLLYFYFRGTLTDKQGLSWKDSWHFIPAIIHVINISPYLFQTFSAKLETGKILVENLNNLKILRDFLLYAPTFSNVERMVLLIAYSLYLFKLLIKFAPAKQSFKNIPYNQYIFTYRWLIILNTIVFLIVINFSLLVLYLIKAEINITMMNAQPMYLSTGIAFLMLPVSLLCLPQILYGIPTLISRPAIKEKSTKKSGRRSAKTVTVISDTEDPFNALAQQIQEYLEQGKPYLNPDFSLSNISIDLKVPQHHLSYCFNNILKIKFTKLRNQLRIAHAKELLLNGSADDFSIDGIGRESGFASRSHFYSAFKSETGFTPNEFLQNREQAFPAP